MAQQQRYFTVRRFSRNYESPSLTHFLLLSY